MELQEKIMNKINGLLAKTVENGCTPEEAAAAAAMVQKLLAKYHLELGTYKDTGKEDVCACLVDCDKPWNHALAHTIAENMCCKVLRHRGAAGGTKLSFIGRETDLEACLATYDAFYEACKKGIRLEKIRCKEEYGTARNAEASYAFGFTQAIEEEMGKQCRALVLVTPEDVKAKQRELFPHVKHTNRHVNLNRDSYENGRRDGRDAAGRREIAG